MPELLGKRIAIDYGPSQVATGVVTEFNWPIVKLGDFGPWYNIRGCRVDVLPDAPADVPEMTVDSPLVHPYDRATLHRHSAQHQRAAGASAPGSVAALSRVVGRSSSSIEASSLRFNTLSPGPGTVCP